MNLLILYYLILLIYCVINILFLKLIHFSKFLHVFCWKCQIKSTFFVPLEKRVCISVVTHKQRTRCPRTLPEWNEETRERTNPLEVGNAPILHASRVQEISTWINITTILISDLHFCNLGLIHSCHVQWKSTKRSYDLYIESVWTGLPNKMIGQFVH